MEPCGTGENMRQCLNNELMKNFDKSQLNVTFTETRNTRPSQQTIQTEHDALISTRAQASWKRMGSSTGSRVSTPRATTPRDKIVSDFLRSLDK